MPARPACSAPKGVRVEDEFDLLDSIFDELDAETLKTLDEVKREKVANSQSRSHSQSQSQSARKPLQPVPSNSQRGGSQSGSKGKGKETSVKSKENVVQSTAKKPTAANKPAIAPRKSPVKPKPAGPSCTLPLLCPTPANPAGTQQCKNTRAADEAALLEGLDWSDEEESDLGAVVVKRPLEDLKGKRKAEEIANVRDQPGYIPISRRFTRCTVISITEKILKAFRREKTLIVEIEPNKDLRRVQLFDEWATTDVEEGDVINIIGDFITPPPPAAEGPSELDPDSDLLTCYLSYSSPNLLILHPDTLISATRVSDTPFCRRKAVVQEKLRSTGDFSPALVYGNLLHELLQACLLAMSAIKLPPDADEQDEKEAIELSFGVKKREEEIKKLLEVPKNVEMLFMVGIELDEARNYLAQKSVGYAEFAESFVGTKAKPESYLTDPRNRDLDPATSTRLAVAGVHDIEEDIWSPRLGLKGKVDASIQAVLQGPPNVFWPCGKEESGVVPFEIKTGKSSGIMQHRAQTMLYTQMMSDRYDREIQAGLLYYTQTNAVIRVDAVRNELRGLIIGRNEMARYLTHPTPKFTVKNEDEDCLPPSQPPPTVHFLKGEDEDMHVQERKVKLEAVVPTVKKEETEETQYFTAPQAAIETQVKQEMDVLEDEDDALWAGMDDIDPADIGSQAKSVEISAQAHQEYKAPLPPAIDEERSCKKCYAADGCMLYRRAVEKVTYLEEGGQVMQDSYEERTGHLTDEQCDFFEKWERLITLEEREMVRFKKEIWTMTARERQKHGRCLANMAIDPTYDAKLATKADKAKIHRYTYRLVRSAQPAPALSQFLPSFTQGTQTTASAEVDSATKQSLLHGQISVNDPVVVSIEPNLLGLARGFVLDVQAEYIELGLDHSITALPGDACDGYAPTSGQVIEDVIYRIDKDELSTGMGRIRDNLAQLFYAKGDEKRRRLIVDLEKPVFEKVQLPPAEIFEEKSNLNADQLAAVNKVITAKDYALILGMPGTGKTTTIAEIIKALTAKGKSVLLTSYTHSAVDNILMKIKDMDIDILRLGNVNRVMPSLAHLTLSTKDAPTSIAQLEQRYFSPQVVATTALSIDHPLFFRRKFDYCIVDEASQITLPTCLGPLRYAETFVLVGDHNQLPPLVRSTGARAGGLETSLFRLLSEAHPSAVSYLTHQYRMNDDIMSLSNRLVYHERLQCGSENVASRALILPVADSKKLCEGCGEMDTCWVRDVISESRNVVFVNTDALPARESKAGRLVQNDIEAELVHQTAIALLACGIQEEQIGVIALYRQQIKLLASLFKDKKGIEVLTADKSQGRDKDCILMSLVRSNAENQVGELLKDWRRLNVCFTRARSKLVIFGSRSTLSTIPLLEKFFDLVDEKGWMYHLPPKAHQLHKPLALIVEGDNLGIEEVAIDVKPDGKEGGATVKREEGHLSSQKKRTLTQVKKEEEQDENDNKAFRNLLFPQLENNKKQKTGQKLGSGILNGRLILQDIVGSQ